MGSGIPTNMFSLKTDWLCITEIEIESPIAIPYRNAAEFSGPKLICKNVCCGQMNPHLEFRKNGCPVLLALTQRGPSRPAKVQKPTVVIVRVAHDMCDRCILGF